MNDPNKTKQVPLSNKEIQIIINLLSKSIPDIDDEDTVISLIDKLGFLLRLQ